MTRKELETEMLEQARLLGMSAERELALLARLETVEREVATLKERLTFTPEKATLLFALLEKYRADQVRRRPHAKGV